MPAKIPCYCHVSPATERELQKTFVGFLRVALPSEWLVNHQPNEGRRGWIAQRDLGDMGVVTGWPDLQLVGPDSRSFFLELKMPKGKESPAQVELGKKFTALRCNFAVARSYEQAEAALLGWGVPLSIKFEKYVAAWASMDRLSADDFCKFIIAAAPPSREKTKKATTSTKRVPNGKRIIASGKQRAA